MSITSEISRLATAKAGIGSAIAAKGVTVPAGTKLDGMPALIDQITGGGGGTPPSANRKDVNFYDDGKLLYSYTLAEAQALSALPDQPTHSGLTGQGWNYTLAQVNALTQAADVGAMYITDDGKTRLYITVCDTLRATVPLYFSQTVADGVTIDWGDGSSTETMAGTGNKNTSHTYAAAGDYCITLDPAIGCTLGLGNGSSSTTVIGGNTNGYRNLLQRVEIGARVTIIGNYAFQKCYSLASITTPSSVTIIGASAFYDCYSLASITIPSSVTIIGMHAFYNCYSLASITIPSGVTSIGASVFEKCYSLASITTPSSVTSIETYAFYDCYSLASITIPSSVTIIGMYAFYDCYSLASITIPSSVTSIGASAFRDCSFVREYHLLRTTPPTLSNTNAFTGIASDCIIYVPAASLAAYQAASNWSTYASKMVGE